MAISFADCGPDRVPALRAFFKRVYGPTYVLAINDRLLAWQFGPREPTLPVSAGCAVRLALLEEEIVGCLGYVAVDVSVGGVRRRGAWVVNWLVDPELRQLGLGPLLMREVSDRFDVTLNLGANDSAQTLLTRMGWTNLGPLPRYVQLLDRDGAARLTESGRLHWPAEASARTSAPGGGSIVRVNGFRSDATDLWRDCREIPTTAGACRSAAFLNWRYARHPVFQYRLFEWRRNEALVGLAVYRVESVRDQPVRIGRMTELIGRPGTEDALLGAVAADAQGLGVAFLDFFCADARMHEAMTRNGFVSGEALTRAGLPMLFQPVSRRSATPVLLAHVGDTGASDFQWYVTTGDADQDRPN
jgi:GNAT superfamily N-acetyltransferase